MKEINMRILQVIPYRVWRNKETGQKVSPFGSLPYGIFAPKTEVEKWEMVTLGWTHQMDNGTTGFGRPPCATHEEALKVMDSFNAKRS